MSIPIIDINSGDTVSSMVDKINYNFTLLSLKGGGPAGIQGIQGTRGYIGEQGIQGKIGNSGATILSGPPPETKEERLKHIGDVYIDNGIIYKISNEGDAEQITNLNYAVQSAFGFTEKKTLNPKNGLSDYRFVLGADTANDTINDFVKNDDNKSIMYVFQTKDEDTYLKFYSKNHTDGLIGNIKNDDNSLCMRGGKTLVVGNDENKNNSINFNSSGITFNNRTNDGTSFANANFIFGTDKDGKSDDNTITCCAYQRSVNSLSLYHISDNKISNEIGLSDITSGKNNKIDKIHFNGNSQLIFSESANKYLNVLSNADGLGDINIMSMSKNGICLGASNGNLNDNAFRLYISSPNQITPKSGTAIVVNSVINYDRIVATESKDVYKSISITTTPQPVLNSMKLVTGVSLDNFQTEMYSSLITVDKNRKNEVKKLSDSLHIHGADDNNGAGCDVIISGGNVIGGNQYNHVGGNVYISGGMAFKTTQDSVTSDDYRSGNVIIGVNPAHHKSFFDSSKYTSWNNADRMGGTNPDDVNFFDINNIALHANKIIIDSDANERKYTEKYNNKSPYASKPENTTVQVSGVNTVKHDNPIILSKDDICSYQFMSGVMCRIIRLRLKTDNKTIDVSSINADTFYSKYDMYTKNDTGNNTYHAGSLYFMSEQVWQKVGNTVHVNAFGRWVANKPGDSNLYCISENFFKYGDVDFNTDWIKDGVERRGKYCINRVLGYILTNTNTSESIEYNDITDYKKNKYNRQPLTIFTLPISITDTYATYCYGHGNVYTENVASVSQNQHVLRTNPIMIGGYYYHNGLDDFKYLGTSVIGSTTYSGRGSKNALHGGMESDGNNKLLTKKHPLSSSVKHNDGRMATTDMNNFWNEYKLPKTEIIDSKYNYIYPEMIMNYGNDYGYNNLKAESIMRPCVGLYTWISMDYSYNIMGGFDYEIKPYGYYDNTSTSTTTTSSQSYAISSYDNATSDQI